MKSQEFALAPMRAPAWPWLVLPVAAIAAIALLLPQQRPLPGPAWLVIPFALALLAIGPLLALRRRRITLAGGELRVAATLYTRRIAISALDLARARIVDLDEHTELAPALKLNGLGVPGLQAGHYLLRKRARAFCLLTDRERVLVLPLRDGGYLMTSPAQPQRLLDALRAAAAMPSAVDGAGRAR